MSRKQDGNSEWGIIPTQLAAMSLVERAKYFASATVLTGGVLEVLGMGGTGVMLALAAGGTAAYFSEEIRGTIIDKLPAPGGTRLGKLNWLITGNSADSAESEQQSYIVDADSSLISGDYEEEMSDEDRLFSVARADDTDGVQRLTVEQIVSHVERNSYKIFIGRSLTKENNPAVSINFYKQHFRFMGASQRGKSSMVAAFLDIVTRTHDKQHVLIALLDKEDQTSNLFAHLPHVARLKIGDDLIKLHARTDDQVLEYLMHLVAIMNTRYEMSKNTLLGQPIILVYVEEFLSLKNTFKSRMERAKGSDEKDKATSDYKTFVYCIEEIAQRGLKARVQLLLCAQVEYADDDFKEALVNVACGMSFCVRPTAAAAAGFRNTELIKQNAKDNKVGQAVVESPDCNDLVLAPDYDLEARIIEWEQHNERSEVAQSLPVSTEPIQQLPKTQVPRITKRQEEAELLARGVNAYCEGATSQPKLAAKLGITAWEARNLMPLVVAEINRMEETEEDE